MNNQWEYEGETRVTVHEAAQISMIAKDYLLVLWDQVRTPVPDQGDLQEKEALIFRWFHSDYIFWAEKSSFWEVQIPNVEDKLKLIGAEELIPIFHQAPAFLVWNLFHNSPDSLLDYLWSFKGEIKVGRCKLSKLQKEILYT